MDSKELSRGVFGDAGVYFSLLKRSDKIAVTVSRRGRLLAAALTALFCVAIAGPAFAETRKLNVYFVHTKERASITFKRNGRYVQGGLKQLNNILRDWRQKEATKMDPRLFDLLWEVYQASGSKSYIHVVSAYRSPKTNAMLRKRSRGVAKKSQHIAGKAVDFYIPDVPVSKLRQIGMKFQVGGVGYYPKSGSPFVHLDVGSVRSWPRMSRKELSRVFPNGKTLHLPTDGKPMPGYKQALADYKSRVSSKGIQVAGKRRRSSGSNVVAGLLGRPGDGDQSSFRGGDSETESRPARTGTRVAAAPAQQPQAAAAPAAQPQAQDTAVPAPTPAPAPAASVGELAYIPTPQSRPAVPGDVAQIALATATTGPLPVTPTAFNAVGSSNLTSANTAAYAAQEPSQDSPGLTVATLINTSSAANTAPSQATGGRVIPVPKVRAGSSTQKGTRVAVARTRENPPPEVVLGSLLNASAMADPADTPLARVQWGTSAGGSTAKNGRLNTIVPRPGLRPDVKSPDAQVITASLKPGRFVRESDDEGGIPVPTRSPLADVAAPVQVALAPASGGVGVRDGGFDMFSNSASARRSKGARPSAADAADEFRNPVRTEPYVTENMIVNRALTTVTLTAMSAAVTAPQFVSSHMRRAPELVHVDGFSLEHDINRGDRFSGQAVNFMTVARFETSDR